MGSPPVSRNKETSRNHNQKTSPPDAIFELGMHLRSGLCPRPRWDSLQRSPMWINGGLLHSLGMKSNLPSEKKLFTGLNMLYAGYIGLEVG